MAAVYVSNLVLNTGTTFSQTFTLEDSESNSTLDLTGYSVNSQMKKHPSSSTKTTFDATVLNASGGIIRVGLASTASVGLKAGRYVYDVLITDSSNVVTRVVEGSVLVRAGVTTQKWQTSKSVLDNKMLQKLFPRCREQEPLVWQV